MPNSHRDSSRLPSITEAEVREVRRSMALQSLTFPPEPIPSRDSAKRNMVIAGTAHDLDDAEQLLQDLLAMGFVRETDTGGIEITDMGYLDLHNRYRFPLPQQPLTDQIKFMNDRLAGYEATSKAWMDQILRMENRLSGFESELSKVKSEYMPKSFWYQVVYPIVVATIPAVVVGLMFFIITVFGPHPP